MRHRASRLLELTLFIAFVVHAIAMFSMLFLLPAMPGGINNDAQRVEFIAAHSWLWHLGWFPWHLAALSDLLLALAILRVKWIARLPALLTLALTLIAVGIEQPNELLWNLDAPRIAQSCMVTGDITAYLDFEAPLFRQVGAVAAAVYAVMAFAWSWCFASAGTWSRLLTLLSLFTWTLLLCLGLAPLLPESVRPPMMLIGVGNAIGFNLMAVWFILVIEAVLRRSRPYEPWGGNMLWRHPGSGLKSRLLNLVFNSRLLRYAGEFVPSVALVSDIEDVIYINYLVESDRLRDIVPWGLELQFLGDETKKEYALFSILTYRHGHFAPRMFGLGHLRALFPSPVQSNWRIHVIDPQSSSRGIYFVSTAVSDPVIALGARMLADGVPMHLPWQAAVTADDRSEIRVSLKPGQGSAPDVEAHLRPCEKPQLQGAWLQCFETYDQFLAYCVPQDRAISSQFWYQQVTRQEIALGIALTDCQPLAGTVQSQTVKHLFGDLEPLCFRVPRVDFLMERVQRSQSRAAGST